MAASENVGLLNFRREDIRLLVGGVDLHADDCARKWSGQLDDAASAILSPPIACIGNNLQGAPIQVNELHQQLEPQPARNGATPGCVASGR